MDDIASSAAGEALSKLINWGAAKITDHKKRRAIGKLLDETTIRASMTSSSIDLVKKFKDKYRIEELLAHHKLEDKSKADTIATFLGEEADDEATFFVGEFYNEVTAIMATADESLANRKTLEIVEETKSDIKALRAEVEKTAADVTAQIVLLEEIIKQLESGEFEVKQIIELAKAAAGTLASHYLQTYYALCTNTSASFATINTIKGNDSLALALASIALSAERADDVAVALKLCSFDTSRLSKAIRKLLEEPTRISGQTEIKIPEIEEATAFVNLVNFEYIYSRNAFQAAADFADNSEIAWNPIAAEKRALSNLVAASMVNSSDILFLTRRTLDRHRPWFPEPLNSQFKTALAIALIRLDAEQVRACVEVMPKELSQFAQDEGKKLALRECADIKVATAISTWAEARQNHVLLINAAIKMHELDETQKPEIIKMFKRCKAWAFPTMGALDLYASFLDPDISYDNYCDYGRGKENEAPFHLVAYKKFRNKNPEIAEKHIARAIGIMKSEAGAPDLLNSYIWVPYLIENDRKKELEDLVESILPLAPCDYVMAFLSAIANCPDSEELLDHFIVSMVNSDFRDPRTAELIAQHLSAKRQIELAGRVALAAFKKAPSEVLAGISAQWMIESSLDIDDDIIRYAEETDTTQMNLLVANLSNENGMPQKRNTYLLRAAFDNSEASARALLLYAIWNTGNKEEYITPNEIGPDTYAALVSSNGDKRKLVFLSNHEAVKTEGASGPAGTVFSTQSNEFLHYRGLRVGDMITVDDEKLTISELASAEQSLMRAGFKELPGSPGGMVITGTPEEMLDKMVELMKDNSPRIDVYLDGLSTESGTLYFGIESGGIINSTRQLEFTIETVCNQNLPYRKYPISKNSPLTSESRFMLSYNALVVLALLNPPDEIIDAIHSKCVVTASTAKRLKKDAQTLADEPYDGSGRIGYDGESPVFYEYNDESKRYTREKSLPIIDLIKGIRKVRPSLANPNTEMVGVLTDNEIIDIQSAAADDLIFVTEDILEAQIIDQFGLTNRCSISSMLLSFDYVEYVLREYTNRMVDWGAEPALETDIVENARNAIRCTLAKFGINAHFGDSEEPG